MSAFLEDRLPVCIRLGASWGEDFAVDITRTAGGSEYRKLIHPYPVMRGSIKYTRDIADMWDEILSLYRRVYGRFAGFRVRAWDNWSTNGSTGAPTAQDQTLELVSAGVYQLVVRYGEGDPLLSIGAPMRVIYKPVSGTVKVGITNALTGPHTITSFTVNTTTGKVTMAANKTRPITAITKGATTVLDVGANTFVNGDSVHVSAVDGMTQINGRRATVSNRTATQITLNIDSNAFTTYTSGGTVNTQPQAGETVTGGCEFDIPCRFDSSIDLASVARGIRDTSDITIVEILNP